MIFLDAYVNTQMFICLGITIKKIHIGIASDKHDKRPFTSHYL